MTPAPRVLDYMCDAILGFKRLGDLSSGPARWLNVLRAKKVRAILPAHFSSLRSLYLELAGGSGFHCDRMAERSDRSTSFPLDWSQTAIRRISPNRCPGG